MKKRELLEQLSDIVLFSAQAVSNAAWKAPEYFDAHRSRDALAFCRDMRSRLEALEEAAGYGIELETELGRLQDELSSALSNLDNTRLEAEELRARVVELEARLMPQPIKTAPETRVLAWHRRVNQWCFTDRARNSRAFTHWLSLPEAPK